MNEMTHRELCFDLARAKGGWIEVPLGSVWFDSPGIADVLVVRPSYTKFCIDIFEMKKTRADFLSDIRKEKWKRYLHMCHRFYFASPKGIITKKDLPDGCGLITKGEKGWYTAKASIPRKINLDPNLLLGLVFYRQRLSKRKKDLRYQSYKKRDVYYRDMSIAKRYGKKVAKAVELADCGILELMKKHNLNLYEVCHLISRNSLNKEEK